MCDLQGHHSFDVVSVVSVNGVLGPIGKKCEQCVCEQNTKRYSKHKMRAIEGGSCTRTVTLTTPARQAKIVRFEELPASTLHTLKMQGLPPHAVCPMCPKSQVAIDTDVVDSELQILALVVAMVPITLAVFILSLFYFCE